MYDTYALLKAEGMTFPPVNQNVDSILLETSAVSTLRQKGTKGISLFVKIYRHPNGRTLMYVTDAVLLLQ
jgi:hypothetical protein